MKATSTVLALALLIGSGAVNAQSIAGSLGLVVYPSADQTPEQQRTDEQECHAWAGETTGVDPENPEALETPATAEQVDSGAAAGAGVARGLARGALMGNLADDDWEQWAAAGAVAGGVRGAKSAQRRNAQAQANATAEQQAAAAEEIEDYKRAFKACIEGRNYTIT
jgi:hypothetical protein